MQYQLDTLHKMRKKAVADLANLAKEFPDDIQAYARVVHGGAERQILHTAMESVSSSSRTVLCVILVVGSL